MNSNPSGSCLSGLSARWAKSTHSGNPSGQCVEARQDGTVQVRDTKDPHSPILEFSPAAWIAFIDGIKEGTTP